MTFLRTLAFAAGLALTATTALTSAASADQLADIKASGKLVCGVLGTLEPFSFQDPETRETVGYDVDLCRAVAADLGVTLEVKPIAVEARIPELMQGRVDIISAALGYTADRAKQIDYSNTSYVSMQKILVKTAGGATTLDDLAQKKISAPKGSTSEKYLRAVLPEATALTFQDPPAAFLALQQSKVSGMILSEISLIKFMNQAGDGFALIAQPVAKEYWGLGLRKDEPALKEAVNATLARLETSGEGKAIFDKWLGAGTPYKMERAFTLDVPASEPVLKPGA
ncbi:MAG: cysteine ABC transporter substrate-binding protein [Rhodovulum sulfidophilum]|uniref:Cysteine ABC transporter substrate-binding protein n=1 Tax=Rhodovulum sulfidophilum TaxID=35806 RepID=A0A2W5N4B0_RHOSU|nr:MAG: cysteine ABC transporter substrate-binding protein [Rhodovulum sulfidophilum]